MILMSVLVVLPMPCLLRCLLVRAHRTSSWMGVLIFGFIAIYVIIATHDHDRVPFDDELTDGAE